MAGHMIRNYLQQRVLYDVWWTTREPEIGRNNLYLNVTDEENIVAVLKRTKPNIVINTTGLLNDDAANRQREAIHVNSLLPHMLAECGQRLGFHLIHISTDCVFSGQRGNYTEADPTDGLSVYAKTKSLGEVAEDNTLVIRTSIIGPELKANGIGLYSWFMRQQGDIAGYTRVFWNGVTTLELSKAIEWSFGRSISGIVHLTAPDKVSKYTLLQLLKGTFERHQVSIHPLAEPQSDKSLVNTRPEFSYTASGYDNMLADLKNWVDTNRRIYDA